MSSVSRISLILGGARSGKSSLAEKLAERRAGEHGVLYLATLQPFDSEMEARVVQHQASRPATWRTIEAPYTLRESLFAGLQTEKLTLIDCLTVWSGNLVLRESGLELTEAIAEDELLPQTPPQAEPDYRRVESEIQLELETLIAQARQRELGLIIVSNEVGMSLVPPYPLGRAYRDLLGRVNQHVAALADEVFLVVAGIPVDLKRLQAELE